MCAGENVGRDVEKIPALKNTGIFGGGMLNTTRQAETGRSKLAIWSTPNFALTVLPYMFFQDLEAGRSCSKSRVMQLFGEARVTREATTIGIQEICEAYTNYFSCS